MTLWIQANPQPIVICEPRFDYNHALLSPVCQTLESDVTSMKHVLSSGRTTVPPSVVFRCAITSTVVVSIITFLFQIKHAHSSPKLEQSFYETYHPAADLFQRMNEVAMKCGDAELQVLNRSHEGRPILLVRIGKTDARNPARFLITAAAHGRERSTALIALYALERFCMEAKSETDSFSRVQGLFVPLMNPDGYEVSRTIQTKWRKNKRPALNATECQGGVDLNRNWPTFWGLGNGTSASPCHEQYQGPAPLSEPETHSIASLLREAKGIRAHVDIHSFGQFLYRSWSYLPSANRTKESEVETRQRHLARAMRVAIRKVYGNDMVDISTRYAALALTRRVNGGTSLDYFMQQGIPSITAEIGPMISEENAAKGFETPEHELLMRCQELFEGLKVALREADPIQTVPLYRDPEIGLVMP